MMTLTVTMNIRPGKRREMLVTLQELTDAMRQEPGFLDARISMKNKRSSELMFIEEWETQEDLDAYLQSYYFSILRGAVKVLTSSPDITYTTQSSIVPDIHMSGIAGTIKEDSYYEKTSEHTHTLA